MKAQISILITKVLSGDASELEQQELLVWLGENESNIEQFGELESIWNALAIMKNTNEFDYQKAHSKFYSKTLIESSTKNNNSRQLSVFDYFVRVAAILVIAVSIPYAAYTYFKSSDSNNNVRTCEVYTPKGSRSLITLSDGTRIWLNAESKITYPDKFVGKTREVFLEGEGYFTVAKDKKHPFIVKTSDINIKVLGTTFNVKSYPSENTIQTTLIEGSVVIEGNGSGVEKVDRIELKPNQQAVFIRHNTFTPNTESSKSNKVADNVAVASNLKKVSVNEEINTNNYTSWKDNKLYFDNEQFESIAVKLERRFGVNISFNDNEVVNYRFSGRFDQISIEEALAALQFASPFKYSIDHANIYIGIK